MERRAMIDEEPESRAACLAGSTKGGFLVSLGFLVRLESDPVAVRGASEDLRAIVARGDGKVTGEGLRRRRTGGGWPPCFRSGDGRAAGFENDGSGPF